MTCELYLIGQPENSGTEIHTIPAGNTAKLGFGATDIEGMQLDGNGGLVITTMDGAQIIIENYEAFACGDDQLTLADGTEIALDSLSTQFQTADALFGGFEVQPPVDNIIDKPEANETTEVALTEGEKYICNFDPNALNKAMVEVADGSLILNFADGSQIVLANYSELIDGELPPELTLADGTVIDSEELLTEVLNLEEALENIEPASGDEEPTEAEMAEIAEQLADTETAAGGGPGGNSGYGFGSTVSSADFDAPDDIGALGATQLAYDAPGFTNQNYAELDSRPDLSTENEFLDETSLLLGPITREGKIDVNYGNDAPGRVLLNGSTSTGGSLLDNTLSSNGVDVVITREGNSYIGKAGDVTVFSFEVETNGSYVFTQFETLDHGDANNDNDTLTINFGVRAVDADGDSTNSSVAVTIADDAPIVLSQITPTLDETNFTSDGLVHVGQFYADIGADVNNTDAYSTTGQFAIGGSVNGTNLTSNGTPIIVTATDTGYVGTANGNVIFTLNIDPSTGAYGYQQLGGIDHADVLDANDMLTLHFGVDVTDFDGDSADGFISINILDDGPIVDNENISVDETNMTASGVSVEGFLDYDLGADGFGGIFVSGDFMFNGVTATINSPDVSHISSGGQPIYISSSPEGYVGILPNGTLVFELELDVEGHYDFTQFLPIDHPDTSSFDEALTLSFGAYGEDGDGDHEGAFINIAIHDDGPVANNDANTIAFNATTASGNVLSNDDNGNDGVGSVITAGTYQGSFGTLVINANGSYTYTRSSGAGGVDSFNYSLRDSDGDVDTATLTINLQAPPPPPPPPPTSWNWNGGDGGDGWADNDNDGVSEANDHNDGDASIGGWGGTAADQDGNGTVDGASSPLTLDLNRNGVELTNTQNGVLFDIDNDGEKEQTSWVGADDGLLTLDRNDDGVITDRSELFGDTDGFDDGFARLASYDSNQDGQITADDEVWSDLKVWQDANQDGVSDAQELLTLNQLEIVSINLNADMPEDLYIEGNWISHVSDFTTADGETHEIVDAWFNYDEVFAYNGVEELTSFGQEINVIHDETTGIFQGVAGGDIVFNIQVSEDGSHDFNLFSPIDNQGNDLDLRFGTGADAIEITVTQDDINVLGDQSGDQFLMDTIAESAENFAAMSQGDGSTDLSMVIDQGDDVTETIQDFVYNGENPDTAEIVEITNANDSGMFDMPANAMPSLEDSSSTII